MKIVDRILRDIYAESTELASKSCIDFFFTFLASMLQGPQNTMGNADDENRFANLYY